MKKIKNWFVWFAKSFLWIIPLLFILDIVTKQLFEKVILKEDGNSIVVIPGFLSFTLTHNTGAAWGIFAGLDWLLVTFSVVCGLAMVALLVIKYKKLNLTVKICLYMLIAGAFGNLIDRAFYPQKVIDFIQFTFIDFPIFNLADTYLVIGVIILMIYELVHEIHRNKKVDTNVEKEEEKPVIEDMKTIDILQKKLSTKNKEEEEVKNDEQ